MGFSNAYLRVLLTNTIVLLFVSARNETRIFLDSRNQIVVNGCLILDFNSSIDCVGNSCTSMPISDFYPKSSHYTSRKYEKTQKLMVGVPKKTGFTEFVNVSVQEFDGKKMPNVTGFSIDVFKAALDLLEVKYDYEFIPFVNASGDSNGTYDDLVSKLNGSETPHLDAVVGDITIRAHREKIVDFSLPYTESGVVMVVKAEPDRLKNMWIFLKPLSWDLWLTIVLAAIFIGVVLRLLERRVNPQRQLGMLVLFPIAALAFPERNMVRNNWARFVLVVWLFLAYVILQSYTANLSSILTVSQLRPADKPACAGYQKDTFVEEILIKNNIKRVPYTSMGEYDEALSKGCKNGGVDAIYDEIPYIKLFLHKYGSKYIVTGPTYSTGGFGFAFRTGYYPVVKPISKAILELMENGTIQDIEKRHFGEGFTSRNQDKDISASSLTSYSFVGLFTVTGFLTLLALVCSECSFAISSYSNQNDGSISRVCSIEATQNVFPESDPQDLKEVVILGQEAEESTLN